MLDINDQMKELYPIEMASKNNVTIQFNKDYHLKLDFVEIDKVSLSFILAPRVENE